MTRHQAREVAPANRILPSHVLVLSADAVDWSREWGVQEIHFAPITEPGMLGLTNINRLTFGPYKRGYPIPQAFCVLDQLAQPVSDWTWLDNPPVQLAVGDTFEFAPGSCLITMTFETHGMRKSRASNRLPLASP